MLRVAFAFIFIIGIINPVFSQTGSDTLRQLKVVEVNAIKARSNSIGYKSETIEITERKNANTQTLAEKLAEQSLIFIKTQSRNGLATSSFRGAGAAHTAVVWNGYNLANSMNGLVDFNLLPVFFFDDLQITYGTSSPQWGSGAVAGTIHLNSSPLFDKGLTYTNQFLMGSFNQKQQQLKAEWSGKKIIFRTKLLQHEADNNYSFVNTAKYNKPTETLKNSEFRQAGLLQEFFFRPNYKNSLAFKIWFLKTNRNIPALITQSIGKSNQMDFNKRFTLDFKTQINRGLQTLRAGYFDEQLEFNDSAINIYSTSNTRNLYTELEEQFFLFKSIEVNLGINNTWSKASANEYDKKQEQNRTSLWLSTKTNFLKKIICIQVNMRKEFLQGVQIPYVVSGGISAQLFKYFKLMINAGQHYRLPTFNDLYWQPGGNADLKPESGWSEDATLQMNVEKRILTINFEISAFNRNISNWIVWQPEKNNIWSPQNVLEVWSRGLEYAINSKLHWGNSIIKLSAKYNFLYSTVERSTNKNDVSLQKQLMYTPRQNYRIQAEWGYKKWTVFYCFSYTGYRFINTDNTLWLNPYSVNDLRLNYIADYTLGSAQFYVCINNLFNTTYQTMAYMPMPMRNYQVGMNFQFLYKQKKTSNYEN
jgi:vitamin B12 transporter